MDRTLWYSIDYEKLQEIISNSISSDKDTLDTQSEPMDSPKKISPIPENSSEITSDMDNPSIHQQTPLEEDRGRIDDFHTKYEEIIDNCELYAINEKYRGAVAHAIKLLLLDVYSSNQIQIGGKSIPSEIVYRDLEGINYFIIQHGIQNFKEASRNFRINNPIAYLKACI
ncbi:hypothetical protein [Clostridium sp. Cult3]|uniref:hypothetical protein n=1 Tax=Clostridium sp. Cult3 TaxID=2079004 RepID=UPI001F2CE317|nr:hypothetical protein [Clostridium sp. Cult3]MCF6459549.1 hypothetical protein [Clostridium sp. Cult3]